MKSDLPRGVPKGSKFFLVLGGAAALLSSCGGPAPSTAELAWAYPEGRETTFGQPLGPGPFHMPGSPLTLTRAELQRATGPTDWYPSDHPKAPAIVRGPTPSGAAPCAECHAFNGTGFPGSADLAGLPEAYIIEQVEAFRSGARTSAVVGQPDTAEMIKVARAVTPQELGEAAAYFAALPRRRLARVVETAEVPRTIPDLYGWLDPAPGGGREPVGNRVVEISDDLKSSFLDDDHVMVTDYAPLGSIARGRLVVRTGGASGTACATCHGTNLRGAVFAPPLAGRSAAYLGRTLWDIRVGARREPEVAAMKSRVQALAPAEIRDAAVYLASLTP